MNIKLLKRYIPFSILIISILSIQPYTTLSFGNTFFWWAIEIVIVYMFWKFKSYFYNKEQHQLLFFVKVYLFYNLFNVLRGLFVADSYWEFKALLANGLALFMPLVAYASTNIYFVKKMLWVYVKYALPLFLFFVFFISTGGKGFYLVPVSFLILFFPILRSPYKWLVLGICIYVITSGLDARSNVIKFAVPALLSLIYYFKFLHSKKTFEFIRKLLIVSPFLFFFLAVTGGLNIFNMDSYMEGTYEKVSLDDKGNKVNEDLKADTRTGLYVEVLQTAEKYNSWLIGRSPAKGNETELFDSISEITGSNERAGNEVAILNIFTWTGMVGILFYFLVFYKASHIAINKSNNIFVKLLGIFIAFRWCYSWVEDINYFTLNTFMLWVMIGLCFSTNFRNMSNKEVEFWLRGIFDKKYFKKIELEPNKKIL